MATQDFAASVQGVAIRVTRLDAAGNLLNGAGDSYTTSAFLRTSFTPEYEEGDEIVEKSADGTVCVSYKAPDTLKRITMELAICEPDTELSQLISGGLLLRKNFGSFASPNNKSVGWAAPSVGDDPSGNGVALEVWSFAVADGRRASSNPYFHWVFPYAKLRQSGDRVIENGMLATTFLTSNVATLTTGSAHGFETGQSVTVSGVDATFNGTYTITATPTPTSFRYAKPDTGDVTSAAVSPAGSVLRNRGYLAVTDFASQGSTSAYNVPGNEEYNADLPIDFIIASTEDPTA